MAEFLSYPLLSVAAASRIDAGSTPDEGDDLMLIDCDTCVVRGSACGECVIGVLLRRPPAGTPVDLDADESAAIDSLVAAGMVPPLRLVPLVSPARDTPDLESAPRRRDAALGPGVAPRRRGPRADTA